MAGINHWTEVTSREELLESEREYRRLFEYAHDAILILEPATEEVLEANQRACELYGFDHDTFVGISLIDLSVFPERGRRQVAITLDTDVTHSFQTEQRRADGTPIYLEVNASVVTYKGRQAILSINRDVSERRRAEEEIRWSNRRLTVLSSVWRTIAEGRSPMMVANDALEAARELVPFDVAGVVRLDHERRLGLMLVVTGEQDLGPYPGAVLSEAAYHRLTDPARARVDYRDRQGGDRPGLPFDPQLVNSSVLVRLEVEGTIIGDCCFGARQEGTFLPHHRELLADLADPLAVSLQQAELRCAVDSHRQRLQVLVDNLPVGVFFLDETRAVQLANPMAIEHLEVLAGASVGDRISTLAGVHLEDLLVSAIGASPQLLTVGDSPPRIFRAGLVPLAGNGNGNGNGYVAVTADVSEEQQRHQQLQQQDRLAAVGQMAAGVAHDFNNLLQAISGFSELLTVRWQLPQPVQDGITEIIKQVKSGAHLIRQILDFSRRSPSARRPLDLVPHAGELTKMLRRMIPEHITITKSICAPDLTVAADPTQIQQIVTNLVVNACDAMPDGGELTISLSRIVLDEQQQRPVAGMATGAWACLAISDTGSGIPPVHEDRIFEPFFTTKQPGAGTGLGLSQVYGLTQQHEGHITFATSPGAGTTFQVFLPLLDEVLPEQAAPAIATGTGDGSVILVVEDDETVLSITLNLLETLGYAALAARNGREAVTLFARHRDQIAMLLSDVIMPGMGGLDLLEHLRQEAPELRAVLMSGYPPCEQAQRLVAGRSIGWLSKPFSVAELTRTLATFRPAGPTP